MNDECPTPDLLLCARRIWGTIKEEEIGDKRKELDSKMKKLVIGIFAHVDAGKTTLSESILYLSGKIGKLGRVDNKDAYLDMDEQERARGITIFSKQAVVQWEDMQITLLDTPGHVDFSAEMERTLQVLDYALLVVSGADGVQGHTKTLWELFQLYGVPVFLFVNKMDQLGTDQSRIMKEIRGKLDDRCISFCEAEADAFNEQLAMCDEAMLDSYLATEQIETAQIKEAIQARKVFPCFFGSALKLTGVDRLLQGISTYTITPAYPNTFGARIFKITRDEQGSRLTHMKLTGGTLKVKDLLKGRLWEEKINQIRLYSGSKFESLSEISAGSVFAVTGLSQARAGEGLGMEEAADLPVLEPVLSYQMIFPEGVDPRMMLPKLRQLEEEEPALRLVWDEQMQEIQVQLMGEVQMEILQNLIKGRFGVTAIFDEGRIVYKESIADVVEGVGHFEPLRHYAEVHLLLAPGAPGSGLVFGSTCSEDLLPRQWQRLVLTHLEEKVHRGVLIGAPITDMEITLVAGKAHNKHTEGGDFREATYRALRQGLREADSVLLEPCYSFQLALPEPMVGRAMMDVEKMHGICKISQTDGETATLAGIAPVSTMRNYQKEVAAYTKGMGRLFCTMKGYMPCHQAEEIITSVGYDPDLDFANPTGSVFCKQGKGFLVDWDQVKDHMHLESCLQKERQAQGAVLPSQGHAVEQRISMEEIDQIFNRTFYANQRKKSVWKRQKAAQRIPAETMTFTQASGQKEKEEEYLLVDGYNIIHAWPELQELVEAHMDGARMKLLDMLSNYQGMHKSQIIVVFDAYRVKGHQETVGSYHNVIMVYTKEAQTADQYIEKFAHDHAKKYKITVATSDGLQQMIIRGVGCFLLSARELKEEMEKTEESMRRAYGQYQTASTHALKDVLSDQKKKQLEALVQRPGIGDKQKL